MQELAAWFGYIVGCANNYNTLWINKLTINHLDQLNCSKDNKGVLCGGGNRAVLEHSPTTGSIKKEGKLLSP
jgi:hypothetical protein